MRTQRIEDHGNKQAQENSVINSHGQAQKARQEIKKIAVKNSRRKERNGRKPTEPS
jgi:hypothetical protein